MANLNFLSQTLVPMAPAALVINLEALSENYHMLCRQLKDGTSIAPAVKANGYGLGMEHISQTLWNEGVTAFFVIQAQEGISLRKALPYAKIYVLSTLVQEDAPALLEHSLIPVLCDLGQLERWHTFALKGKQKLPCAIHIDTGLIRTGFHEKDVDAIPLDYFNHLDLTLVMSHLACPYVPAHPLNREQLETFKRTLKRLPPAPYSLANSGGICLGEEYHFDVVRPGLALYGSTLTSPQFKPVVHVFSQIVQIEDVPQGKPIGYEGTFTTTRPSRIATLGIGYADGILRSLSNKGFVYAKGKRFPIVGRISMDLMTIDITETTPDTFHTGDWVELMGEHILLDDMAHWAGTEPWEILTNLGSRYTRFYVKHQQELSGKVAA